jgi:hypothetical protein
MLCFVRNVCLYEDVWYSTVTSQPVQQVRPLIHAVSFKVCNVPWAPKFGKRKQQDAGAPIVVKSQRVL